MFSWITGPRITNVIEDLQSDPAYDTTFIEPPDTPAHQFAVKAFKQAIFGTPAPADASNAPKKLEKKARLDAANAKNKDPTSSQSGAAASSPTKAGILMTPGTASKGRKTVKFGAQVVDNEGKRSNSGSSGIPSDCPGKFPSPFTPGTELKDDAISDKKPRTKLTAALYDARTAMQATPGQKAKARDDSDITLDMGAPRSESGKFWKGKFELYAENSEKEMKKLVAKQQLAKSFAKQKDGEMTELTTRLNDECKRARHRERELEQQNKELQERTTRLNEECKRARHRERELEQQNKEFQERLRAAMAENTSASVEITALKNRIDLLEKSLVPSSETQGNKMSFQIYEDSKDSAQLQAERQKTHDISGRETDEPTSIILGKSPRASAVGKENSPPKPRHARRQTLPDTSLRLLDTSSRPATSHAAASTITAAASQLLEAEIKSAQASILPFEPLVKPGRMPRTGPLPNKSPLVRRQPESSKENAIPPKSPRDFASSPLPQPSPAPDPWMQDFDESSLAQIDKMALPISSGQSSGTAYSRPIRASQATRAASQRATKSRVSAPRVDSSNQGFQASTVEKSAPQGSKFDMPKSATHHAEGSSAVSSNRFPLSTDRREMAKLRLAQRKQKKLQG
ncbi:hypothetical protein EJ04DRAFT_514742 [Polyplosphaeria fusca]|uniref:Spindle pole body-associated protein cut12 domain-containing protein n=1 Tax=Polyplosphaeria fusca TaxID=682080 RepID=A0A9P4QPF2_9PLEO|nr:hypothetical protein EJ04DRAFT_514742 [Polyplosphaeria fusca]